MMNSENRSAFTARRVAENEEAKYINTTETDIYKKGNLIFNYHRAKQEARKAKKAYLVEGAMDVLCTGKGGAAQCSGYAGKRQ